MSSITVKTLMKIYQIFLISLTQKPRSKNRSPEEQNRFKKAKKFDLLHRPTYKVV